MYGDIQDNMRLYHSKNPYIQMENFFVPKKALRIYLAIFTKFNPAVLNVIVCYHKL